MFMPQKICEVKNEMDLFHKDVEAILAYTKSLEVRSKREAKAAINYIARSRALSDVIEKKKLSITKSVRDYVAEINNLAKEFLEPLALVEDMILQKIDSWKISHEESIELQTMEEDIFSLETAESFETVDTFKTEEATAYEEVVYEYKITDSSLIPEEYVLLNYKELNSAMKNGIGCIPGLQITTLRKTKVRRSSK